jgi:hypothetical protein
VGACAGPSDRDRYRAALADPAQRSPSACAALRDPALAGDCGLVVAQRRLESGEAPEAACASVPAGTYRSECWFVAAEAAAARDLDGRAAALCRRAGALNEDCAQHLWQGALHALTRRPGGDLVALTGSAERLHRRWAGLLAWTTDFDARFWAQAFQGAALSGGFDPARCGVLTHPAAGRCEAAMVELFSRELAPALARAGVELCALPPTAEAAAPYLRAAPHPAFGAVVRARQDEVCAP